MKNLDLATLTTVSKKMTIHELRDLLIVLRKQMRNQRDICSSLDMYSDDYNIERSIYFSTKELSELVTRRMRNIMRKQRKVK